MKILINYQAVLTAVTFLSKHNLKHRSTKVHLMDKSSLLNLCADEDKQSKKNDTLDLESKHQETEAVSGSTL
jgi:hypothetical protein